MKKLYRNIDLDLPMKVLDFLYSNGTAPDVSSPAFRQYWLERKSKRHPMLSRTFANSSWHFGDIFMANSHFIDIFPLTYMRTTCIWPDMDEFTLYIGFKQRKYCQWWHNPTNNSFLWCIYSKIRSFGFFSKRTSLLLYVSSGFMGDNGSKVHIRGK